MTFDLKLLRHLPKQLLCHLEIVPCCKPGVVGPCVLWTAPRRSRNQYGRKWCTETKRERQTHIMVWERVVGPVPQGLVLDHLCSVRSCCAPWHLEPVTIRENTRRGNATLFKKPEQYDVRA